MLLVFSAVLCFGFMSWLPWDKAVAKDDFLERMKKQWTAFWSSAPEDRIYLQLDRPLYYPGDSIHFSAYLRDGANFRASRKSNLLHIELIDPKGTVAQKLDLDTDNGRTLGGFALGTDVVGGLYIVKAYTNWQLNDPEPAVFEKEINVQKVVMPNLKMKLDFEKKSYSGGEEVVAKFEANSNDNKALSNTALEFKSSLDGAEFKKGKAVTDANGKCELRFNLPAKLNSSDGLLNIMIVYQGNTESISRSIPIAFNKINIQFYPEGGDLVSGLDNKVAFRSTDEHGKPTDISASLYNGNDEKLLDFSSYDRGMGSFNFKLDENQTYYVKIDRPSGLDQHYELPKALSKGYLIRLEKNQDHKASFVIQASQKDEISLFAQVRGKIYYAEKHQINKGSNTIEINTDEFPIGVAQLTLFDSRGIGRAERLFFVNSGRKLDISIKTDKEKYQPGEMVKMKVNVKDDRGMPMPASLSMAVVNDQLLSFADDRSSNILSRLLLESDIKGKIEDPTYYFNPEEKKTKESLDLLMLTSGWRRFVWKDIEDGKKMEFAHEAEYWGTIDDPHSNRIIVKGMVFDQDNKQAIPGCTVLIKGEKKGTITNLDGRFELKDVRRNDILVFSFIGYETVERKATDAKKIVLASRQDNLEEVVVVGYGVQKRAMIEREMDKNEARHNKKKEMPRAMNVQAMEINEEKAVVFDDAVGDVNNAENPTRIREFAVDADQPQKEVKQDRRDFNPTVYWNGLLEVDRRGEAEITFKNNDQISSFSIKIEGIGKDGSLGVGEKKYYTQLPFSISGKLPFQVVSTDLLQIPINLVNHTDYQLSGKLLIAPPAGFELQGKLNDSYKIPAQQSTTVWLKYKISNLIGKGRFSASFDAGNYKDAFSQEVEVIAKGFPVDLSFAGQDLDKSFTCEINDKVEGSMTAQLVAYPSVVSDLLKGVEGILREPYGCFEQTSMSSYPNLFVLDYLKTTGSEDKKLLASAEQLLGRGYKRLTSYETPEKGYEWFGGAPAHEALTAYGLMQFNDMKSVSKDVDQAMIDRTAKWLMDRRDGQGGFLRNDRALDSYGRAPKEITNAYIVYAMAEAGYKDISKEYEAAKADAINTNDPYRLALVANAAYALQKEKDGDQLLGLLAKLQKDDGSWTGTSVSITYSSGMGLNVETSSLAVMAFLKSKSPDNSTISKGVKYILTCRSGYGDFGSTQSTVLALKALTQYAKFSKRTAEAGEIEVLLDGKQIAKAMYAKGETKPIEINGLEKFIANGKSQLSVRYSGTKVALPYSVGIKYYTNIPRSSNDCKLGLSCKWEQNQARVGETLRLVTVLSNKSQTEGLPMSMAVIGIPAGLSAQAWQLKELKEKQMIDFYELKDNFVVCYFRQMKPGETKEIKLDLKAEFQGKFDSPASSAYLYYTNEFRNWQLAGGVEIKN